MYEMHVDSKIYDITNPEFIQTHCLRFEIEKTPTSGDTRQHGVKITDIDYYLGGNRHAKAKSDELYK